MAAASILLAFLFLAAHAHGSTFTLDLHHRFSEKVRSWAGSISMDWPEKGTPEYYTALFAYDQALLHGRGLISSPQDLTFADGNETFEFIGSLHYALVELGTPKVPFLVALDTGSDLFWVPCDCTNCAPTSNEIYNISYNIFNSSASSTSKTVPCSSSLCDLTSSCSKPTDTCPYKVQYYDNTSSTGVLLEDVMYFVTDDARQEALQTRVTFGCGQKQPYSFTGVPNGLLGLGLENISVPSTLVASGLVVNSFSMCFSPDGSGRISFGDKGSSDQPTTPFYPNISNYVVTATDILIGGNSIKYGINAYFDSGSSYTLLSDPVYTALTRSFNSSISRQPLTGIRLPFEYCYAIGPNEARVAVPTIALIMKGGKEFDVQNSIVGIANSSTSNIIGFCLAIVKGSKINIIGQNFMTGYKVVYDRDKLVLGWTSYDCYNDKEIISTESPAPSPTSSPVQPPSVSSTPKIAQPPVSPGSPVQKLAPLPTSTGNSVPPVIKQSLFLSKIFSLLLFLYLFAF